MVCLYTLIIQYFTFIPKLRNKAKLHCCNSPKKLNYLTSLCFFFKLYAHTKIFINLYIAAAISGKNASYPLQFWFVSINLEQTCTNKTKGPNTVMHCCYFHFANFLQDFAVVREL